MGQEELLKIFRENGALLEGHFVLSSGLHSKHYVQCAKLFESPEVAGILVKELANSTSESKAEWVVGPAMGGILLAYELARRLRARNAFTERVEGKMALRRGFLIPPKSRVMIAEDVLTTGGSALEVAALLESQGTKVAAIAALVNRSGVRLPYPTHALLSLKLEAVKPEACDLCGQGKPLVKPGSREK